MRDTTIDTLSMRSINNRITDQFRDYCKLLGDVVGSGGLIEPSQIHQVYDQNTDGKKAYAKGKIVFRNGMDRLEYLLDHRNQVASVVGVSDADDIFRDRRDLGKIKNYLSKLQTSYDMGDVDLPMQMYISKHDDNIGDLNSLADWQDYIMT